MIFKKLFFGFFLFFITTQIYAETITVAVASNAQYVFEQLKADYKKQTGQDVQAIYSSSGTLVAQIANGAPFHLFLSADMEYPNALYQKNLTTAAPRICSYGELVLWTMRDFDLTHWQELLMSNKIRKIALANPKTAPHGRESMRALRTYKLDAILEKKFVFGENISQTNLYIHSGVVDIGITSKSTVHANEVRGKGKWIALPATSYAPVAHGVVVLKYSESHEASAAKQFFDFLFSEKARTIFQQHGYLLP